MNPYNFCLLLFAFSEFFLGVLVLLKRMDKLALHYFIFSTFASFWAAVWSILISENITDFTALVCSRFAHIVGGLTGITWLHFCLVLVERNKKCRGLIIVFYAFSILFSAFAFSKLFVSEIRPAAGFSHYTKTGPILDMYLMLFLFSVVWAFIELGKGILRFRSEKRIQVIGFFVSTLIGFVGGIGTLLPIYGINFPQYNLFIIPIYPFIMAFFIIRRGFFDPEAIIQLLQHEKLAAIGLLAASVNHEIRNPLYAAQGMLQNFKEKVSKKTPEETVDKTLEQVNRALEVIANLNRFSKPMDQAIASNSQASVPEAIQTVLDLVSYEFSLDKIKINNQIPADLPQIKADQRQLEEIFFNLIVNACHAMVNGGELVIASEQIHSLPPLWGKVRMGVNLRINPPLLSSPTRGEEIGLRNSERIRITISDTGSGIPQDQMKHLFEPFHTTKGDKGTGLGLYITKQLVERNGGKIMVKSKEGQGTSFILEFRASSQR